MPKVTSTYTCETCDKAFVLQSCLTRHTKAVHLKHELFRCEFCDKRLSSRMSMLAHSNVCGENPYIYTKEDLEKALKDQREELEHEVEEELKHRSKPEERVQQTKAVTTTSKTLATNSIISF